MLKSKSNSVRSGKYIFQPKRYDKDDNLICAIYRENSHKKEVCKLTGVYKFDEDKFEVLWEDDNWLTSNKHLKLLKFFLEEYDWSL